MGDLAGRGKSLTVRLSTIDRRYVQRIAKLRRVSMADIVAEMVELHRAREVDQMKRTATGVAIVETKSAA